MNYDIAVIGGGPAGYVAALAKRAELTADELADTVHAHPTYSEALMEAAAVALGRCVHLPRQK